VVGPLGAASGLAAGAAELFFVAADFGGEGMKAVAELVDLDSKSGEGDMVHGDAALGQQLLNVPVGQAVPQIPADRDHDHLPRKPEASEH